MALLAVAIVVLYCVGYLLYQISPALVFVAFFAAIYAGPISLGLMDDYLGSRRMDALLGCTLSIDGQQLVQRRPDGSQFSISVTRPFTYQYLYRADDVAVYRLRQRGVKLDFASTDPLAETVVSEVLRLHWPPRAIRAAGT
jgi:hypothetical protein